MRSIRRRRCSRQGESNGQQQYPQPRRRRDQRSHLRRRSASEQQLLLQPPAPASQVPEQQVQQAPPMQYPVAAQPTGETFPVAAQPLPTGQVPSDYDLMQRNVPPLKAYLPPEGEQKPMTERQQIELSAAQLEGMFSSWVGGSVIGRYRSGTHRALIDWPRCRAPFEASVVIGNGLRLTVIPTAVFLNSGQHAVMTGNAGDIDAGAWAHCR